MYRQQQLLKDRMIRHLLARITDAKVTTLELWQLYLKNDGEVGFYNADGSNLYSGLSGVLVALTEALGEDYPIEEIKSACARLISILTSDSPELDTQNCGLYDGQTGVIYAVLRYLEKSGESADNPVSFSYDLPYLKPDEFNSMDLIGGYLGYVLGAGMVAKTSGCPRDRALVHRIGMDLERLPFERFTFGLKDAPELIQTGVAHGSSGAMLMLNEYAKIMDSATLRQKALKVSEVEDSTFDELSCNWTDWRHRSPAAAMKSEADLSKPQFPYMWCTGAPGTLMVRQRLYRDLKNPIVLKNTGMAARRLLQSETQNPYRSWCLCHGLLGNIRAFRGYENELRREHLEKLSEILTDGFKKMAEGQPFPHGMGQGVQNDDSLMTGTSGLLYFLCKGTQEETLLLPSLA